MPDPITTEANESRQAQRRRGRPPSKRQNAKELLRDRLRDGPRLSTEIAAEASAKGISAPTLERAKRELGFTSRAVKGRWYCVTPEQNAEWNRRWWRQV